MVNEKILVVDDEEHIAELISYNLTNNGYKVIIANNGIDAVKLAVEEKPSLILLDLMIPGKDGYDVCKDVRSNSEIKNTPIIMLTAKSEEVDKILGLELGADDYITKPFSIRELMLRIKNLLNRVYGQAIESQNTLEYDKYLIDFDKRVVLDNNVNLILTTKEYDLLLFLVKNKGKAFSRDQILDAVWGSEYFGSDRVVDDLMRRLRQKMPALSVETIYGFGYRLL